MSHKIHELPQHKHREDQVMQPGQRLRQAFVVFSHPDFNETQARRELIDPLFQASGWDMDNRLGRGEVRHEGRVFIKGKAKAPDYGFRLDGRLRLIIDTVFPIAEAQIVHEYVLANRNIGKVILELVRD